MRFDHVAVFIFDERRVALLVGHSQQFPCRRADADGENAHARLRRLLGRGHRFGIGVVIFAIGEKHQNFMIVVAFFKGASVVRMAEESDVPPMRNDADRDGIDRLLKSLFVQGQRRLQKSVAGENDQAQAVRFWPAASGRSPPVCIFPGGWATRPGPACCAKCRWPP